MLLAHTGKDGLAELLGVLDIDSRILGSNPVEGVAYLGLVVLVDGLDSAAVLGVREYHRSDSFLAGLCEGNVGLSGFELHDATDITGSDGGDFLLLGACDCINGAEALSIAGQRIDEVSALIEGTTHYLEVRNFTEMLLDRGLEDEEADRTCRVA